ncbi:Di-copper centre-containing protein [Pseudovirgaria hyperparasitica]|uniref:Di-copper centre-containing protein n=1 Tax=Pseudovirgaria hyperparasitica TaxID=470096 RepID=A0A6A6WID7_9PEZI|nr:Di-copper centre-containing protein [Pseudovirgaria hyperparasitica]KAF2761830.1 Di-copper centre-containing protein [Pseudovirgaria hyperparasitica]
MIFSITVLLAAITCLSTTVALPQKQHTPEGASCSKPLVRREWRQLSDDQKDNYINAVQCLREKPPQSASYFKGVKNRYDDFVAGHINETDFIHFVGFFQVWHRVFVHEYETALGECGYKGGQPYWDWTLDATIEGFPKSPIFDAEHGFGGNGPFVDTIRDPSVRLHIPGKTGGGCVTTGPFANISDFVHMGPLNSTAYNPRCLRRDFSPWLASKKLRKSVVDLTLSKSHFATFDIAVQGMIDVPGLTYHGGGHLSVGGDIGMMGDVYNSPSDPIFFLHHANLDRLWALWQAKDAGKRTYDIAGPIQPFAPPFDFHGPVTSEKVTLDYNMWMGHFVKAAPGVYN